MGEAGWPVVRLCSVGQAGLAPGVSLCSMLIFSCGAGVEMLSGLGY